MDIRTPGRVGYVLRDSSCTRWPAPLRAYARRPGVCVIFVSWESSVELYRVYNIAKGAP